jgi:hypothetical protein
MALSKRLSGITITETEWNTLIQVRDFLSTFKFASKDLEKSNEPTINGPADPGKNSGRFRAEHYPDLPGNAHPENKVTNLKVPVKLKFKNTLFKSQIQKKKLLHLWSTKKVLLEALLFLPILFQKEQNFISNH